MSAWLEELLLPYIQDVSPIDNLVIITIEIEVIVKKESCIESYPLYAHRIGSIPKHFLAAQSLRFREMLFVK